MDCQNRNIERLANIDPDNPIASRALVQAKKRIDTSEPVDSPWSLGWQFENEQYFRGFDGAVQTTTMTCDLEESPDFDFPFEASTELWDELAEMYKTVKEEVKAYGHSRMGYHDITCEDCGHEFIAIFNPLEEFYVTCENEECEQETSTGFDEHHVYIGLYFDKDWESDEEPESHPESYGDTIELDTNYNAIEMGDGEILNGASTLPTFQHLASYVAGWGTAEIENFALMLEFLGYELTHGFYGEGSELVTGNLYNDQQFYGALIYGFFSADGQEVWCHVPHRGGDVRGNYEGMTLYDLAGEDALSHVFSYSTQCPLCDDETYHEGWVEKWCSRCDELDEYLDAHHSGDYDGIDQIEAMAQLETANGEESESLEQALEKLNTKFTGA